MTIDARLASGGGQFPQPAGRSIIQFSHCQAMACSPLPYRVRKVPRGAELEAAPGGPAAAGPTRRTLVDAQHGCQASGALS